MAKFAVGDNVINLLTKEEGVICEVRPPARGRQLYRVKFRESTESCLEQNLDGLFDIENPFDRIKKGLYGNRDQFVLVNTTHKINNSNNNTISSLKASKTIFKAYQFKPLLKFLNSPNRSVLIADEVGLGKTIEAGHILLELKARGEFKSALIVCPNSLKIKWQTELKDKFGLNFKIYESLQDAVEHMKSNPQNARGILNYEKIRVKRKLKETDDENQKKSKKKKNIKEEPSNVLIEFLKSGIRKYSIVLCDEAHKLRNHETLQYHGMSEILNYAVSAVFLTATPIMLKERDLYNLLHLLNPQAYSNEEVFLNQISANRPFIKAISMLNANQSLAEIKEVLKDTIVYKFKRDENDFNYWAKSTVYEVYKGIPLYEQILNKLDREDTLALRAQLQNEISSMSSINNIFSRTRKREVSTEERQQTERDAHKYAIQLSGDERLIYDEVINNYIHERTGIECDMYYEENLPQECILGLIQRKRMVASSVYGYKLFTDAKMNVEDFCRSVEENSNLKDSKIENLEIIAKGVEKAGASKLIVFSIFKFTVRYLTIRMKKLGYKVFAIHGDIKDRENIIQQFKDCSEFAILISTEVGSEGLDMQFCSHLVNYDLPWNPMVVEQRIGRIDRFGQKAAKVHIYNMVVANTIQESVYDKLLDRIGIFQGVIGDLEMILEENKEWFSHLEHDIYGMELTQEEQERKILDLSKAMENQKIHIEQVEKGMTNALTNDVYFQNEIQKIKSHKLYVTEEELLNYLRMLIKEHLTTCTLEKDTDNEYSLSVPKSKVKVINNFITSSQPVGEDYDDIFRPYRTEILEDFQTTGKRLITFNQNFAFENKNADYVNIYNPLIIAASEYFKKNISTIGKTFQLKSKESSKIGLKKGEYFMAVYIVITERDVLGKNIKSETLLPVIYDVSEDKTICDNDFNLSVFGELQSNATNMTIEDGVLNLSDETISNMESDFAQYIYDHINHLKDEIEIIDNSQKELHIRQLTEYYDLRIEKELKYIEDAKLEIVRSIDEEEKDKAEQKHRLAELRYNNWLNNKRETIERASSTKTPKISNRLISLNRIKIY